MKKRLLQIVESEKLTRVTHWAVFSLGATTLGLSVLATALRAFAQ